MKLTYSYRGQSYAVELRFQKTGYQLAIDGAEHTANVISTGDGEFIAEVDGKPAQVAWTKQGRKLWVHVNGRSYELEKAIAGRGAGAANSDRSLRAPIPGQVRKVVAQVGEQVEAGALLMVLEAMKMEIRIQAPHAAKVASINVQEGQTVEKDQLLVELEA